VVRIETLVDVAAADMRAFYADQPYRSIAQGVGIEVRGFDGSGRRRVLITHDSTLGYVFSPEFQFTLLPPPGPDAAPRLSIVARAVGVRDMIGATPAIEAGFARGASVDVVIADQRCGGAACGPNELCCDGACVRVLSDARNCGRCGNACGADEQCAGGVCQCGSGSGCGAGQTCCPGLGCVDLKTDAFNCGTCRKECNPGEMCVDGSCSCNGGAACAAGSTSDALCCPGSGCSSTGTCTCGGTDCAAPRVCCNGSSCVDLRNDPMNCGVCGRTCPPGLTCTNGACTCAGRVCAAADTCCPTGCANLQNDVRNCGACGHSCQAGEVCQQGTCVCAPTQSDPGGPGGFGPGGPSCNSDETCRGGMCTVLNDDVRNCGACGNNCRIGEECAKGECSCEGGSACVGNQRCCPPQSNGTPGGCFDTSSDPAHCGACDKACGAGESCRAGVCTVDGCGCTNGNRCEENSKECRCNGGPACSGATTCCATGCKNLLTDVQNCGMCGRACVAGQLCCNGSCVDQGPQNCGGCGMKCALSCCPPCTPGGNYSCATVCLGCGGI
jgi:hypothetical protein